MEVSFVDVIKVIIKRWWIILLAAIVGGVSAFLITNTEKPRYVSEASLYAEVRDKEGDYTFSDLNFVHALIPTFYDIMNEDGVYDELSAVLAEQGVTMTRDQLKSKFAFVNNGDTSSQSLLFRVRCTDPVKGEGDEYMSTVLLNGFLNIAIERVPEIISSVELHVLPEPHYVSTIYPNTTFNTVLGAFVGMIAGLLVVFIINSLDTRIESAQELSKKFGVPVIGVIPAEIIITTKGEENNG